MKSMRKIFAVLLVLVLALSLCACGAKKEEAAAPEKKEEAPATAVAETKPIAEEAPAPAAPKADGPAILKVAHKGDPTSLCHLTVTFGSTNGPVDCLIYDRLVDYDAASASVKPMLATAWEKIDDTHFRFTLRDDVVAHDGVSKFTASDVVYTIKTGVESGMLANYYGGFNVDECKAEDDTHVIVATNAPDPYVLFNLSNIPLGMIVEAAVPGGDLESQNLLPTCGTGPYKVKEWSQGSYILFEKNDKYWGTEPYYDEVEFKIITDASARVMNLESGDVNICLDPATSQLSLVQDNSAFTIVNYATSQCTTMYLNCTKAPFDDVKVRQAIAQAINYDADLAIAAGGYGYTTDSFLAKTNTGYSAPDGTVPNYYNYNVEAAKKLMSESGYPNGCSAQLLIMEGASFDAYATLIQQQLAEIGITIEIVPTASAAFYDLLSAGDFQAEIVNSSNPDPAVQVKYFDHRVGFKAVRGGTGWTGPAELDTLIDQAKVEMDEAANLALYKQIADIINENAPAIPLYSPNKICIADSNIANIKLTEFGDIDVSKCYVK